MIISVSGKKGSGKDTVGKIIQILTLFPEMSTETVIKSLNKEFSNHVFENKKWADKLKDIVCLLIGCTREQLEDREFKEKPLDEEWWYYKYLLHKSKINSVTGDFILDENGKTKRYPIISEKTHEQEWKFISKETVNEMSEESRSYHNVELVKLTPRLLLQLIGTDCMRNIIHPNIWVNSLMSEYRNQNWIITDTRFPNEYEAVKTEGFSILVSNNNLKTENEHISETALDGYNFDYYLDNTEQDYSSLIKDIKLILLMENLI